MPSNLYRAGKFSELQAQGKVAKGLSSGKKLKLDSKGFYLNKHNSKGDLFQQRIKSTDMVYTRNSGVTKYSPEKDSNKRNVRHIKETPTEHTNKAHKYDRASVTGNTNYTK